MLQGLPTARDPWVLLEQTPGVVMNQQNVGGNKSGQQSTFTVHGTQQGNSIWNVDGVTITDMAATGSSSVYFDFDSFQEISFTTGGADASVQTGGVNLNFVTKSGGNTLRGSGRYFVSDNNFQSTNITPRAARAGRRVGQPAQEHPGLRRRDRRTDPEEQGVVLGRLRQAGHRGRRDRLPQAGRDRSRTIPRTSRPTSRCSRTRTSS